MGAVLNHGEEPVWGDLTPTRAKRYLAAALRSELGRISSATRMRRRTIFGSSARIRRIVLNGIGDWDQIHARLVAAGLECANAQPHDVLSWADIAAQVDAGAAAAALDGPKPPPASAGVKVGRHGVREWQEALRAAVFHVEGVRVRSAMVVAEHLAERFVLTNGDLAAAAVVAVRDVPGVSHPTVTKVLKEFVRLEVLRPAQHAGDALGDFQQPARAFVPTVPCQPLPTTSRPDSRLVVALGAGLAEAWESVPRDGTPFSPRQIGQTPRVVRRLVEVGLVRRHVDADGNDVWGRYVAVPAAEDVVDDRLEDQAWATENRAARYAAERERYAQRVAYLRGETDDARAAYLAERDAATQRWADAALELAGCGLKVVPVFGVLTSGKCGCDLRKDREETARVRRSDKRRLALGLPLESAEDGFVWPADRPSQCANIGKHPMFKAWVNRATSDPDQIRRFAKRYPYANIGVVADGLVVLDVDARRNGERVPVEPDLVVAELARRGLHLPADTPAARTGSGGFTLWFAQATEHQRVVNREDTAFRVTDDHGVVTDVSIDVRCDGGNVVVPPSRHYSGGTYTWLRSPHEHRFAPFTDDMVLALRATSDTASRSPRKPGRYR
ncbi:MAG TPA: bifunctional DNA primase/polymerase [Acidimicrobiales bacterium]|nr:bifunctional DNA primase/polymerase [Acidimicrobiales bacterium]